MSMMKGPSFNRNHKGRNGFTHRSQYAIYLVSSGRTFAGFACCNQNLSKT